MSMYGPWRKISIDLHKFEGKQRDIKEYILHESAKEFQEGIRARIVSRNIAPDSKESSALEYAQKIEIDKKSANATRIGLPKQQGAGDFNLGTFALEAEYGLHGNRFIGVWRNYIAEFEERVKMIIDRIQKK